LVCPRVLGPRSVGAFMSDTKGRELSTKCEFIAELKELAKAATPGPWKLIENEASGSLRIENPNGEGGNLTNSAVTYWENTDGNGSYIAAANPQAILRLIERLERYEEALKFYADESKWDSVSGNDCYVPNSFRCGKNNYGYERAREALK